MEDEQTKQIIERLQLVKDEFIKSKDELAVSIRKDVVAAELKDILLKNKDYESLKKSIDTFIKNLYNI